MFRGTRRMGRRDVRWMTSNRQVAPDGSTASLPIDEVSRFIALEGGKNEHQAEASL